MKKRIITNKSYYFLSLGTVVMLAAYPIIMGVQLLAAYFRDGQVDAALYPKYVIPYTPIAIALIIVTVLFPLIIKMCKKFALPVLSLLGVGLFLLSETGFEQVTVFSQNEGAVDVGSWQTYLCVATPEVLDSLEYRQTIGASLTERYSPAFKVHFYLIAILIVLAVLGVIYGFSRMVSTRDYSRKKPMILQTVAVTVYICLCVFACFTAFYRTGELNLSAVSACLMSIFFVVFGMTAGAYAGSILYFKPSFVSRIVPAIIAAITTFVMYVGELVLMGGVLFKFGSGFFFEPVFGSPFAAVDIMVIFIAGILTYGLLYLIRPQKQQD